MMPSRPRGEPSDPGGMNDTSLDATSNRAKAPPSAAKPLGRRRRFGQHVREPVEPSAGGGRVPQG